jgi:FkbM family methyltransferase
MKKGESGITGNFYCHLSEFNEMLFLLHFLRSNDLWIDIGANSGSYTILGSKVIGAETISVEPSPVAISRLKSNVQLNEVNSLVKILPFALGAKKATVKLTSNLDTMNHIFSESENLPSKNPIIEVEQFRLDDIMGDRYPSLIKIDVEGYENDVIVGGIRTLQNLTLKAVICETLENISSRTPDRSQVFAILESFGFRAYTYDGLKRELVQSDNWTIQNTIFVRDFEYVNNRIATASLRKIGNWRV